MNRERTIYRPVFYDDALGGYCYQWAEGSPLYGPFRSRREAWVDVEFHHDEEDKTGQPRESMLESKGTVKTFARPGRIDRESGR